MTKRTRIVDEDASVKATVFDYTASNPLAVRLTDTDGNYVAAGGGGGGTQYAEDTAHVSGDQVTMAGVVQQSADAALSGDGDRSVLQVDSSGFLKVNIKAGSGSGGTAQGDKSGFTEGSTSFTPVGGVLNDTISADPTEDQAAAVRITAKRAIHVNLRDASGNEVSVGGGTQYDEDTASTAAEKVTMAGVVRKDTAASLVDTDGDRTEMQVDSSGRLYVNASGVAVPVTDNGGSLTVDNAALAVTGGGVEATALRVTVASDSTGVLSVDDNGSTLSVDDGAGSLTVDNAALSVTGGGVEASALRVTIASDSTGVVSVDDNGGSITVDGTVSVSGAVDTELTTADLDTGAGTDTRAVVGLVGSASGGGQLIPGSATDGLLVNLGANNDVTITGTVTVDSELPAAAALADNTSNPTAPAVGAFGMMWDGATWDRLPGTSADGVTVNLGANNDVTATGSVAHDAADSGSPVKIGAKAVTSTETVTLVASGDRTDLYADLDGVLVAKLNATNGDLVSERVADTSGTSTAFTNFGAVASTRNYVTAIHIYNSSATAGYVDFRDGAAGSVLFTAAAPAGGGMSIANAMPLFKTTANTALAYDVSGALSTVYISVSGFQSKA